MTRVAAGLALCVLAVGCGGGGGGGGDTQTPPPVVNASPGGIWEGKLGSGQDVLGLVTESGEFHFLTDDGTQYFGTVTTNANTATAQFTGYTQFGFVFEDGTTRGTGSLTGTVQARSTFNASTTFRTSAGNNNSNTVTLTYHTAYERDSSLATISGNFRDLATGNILSIDSNGVAFLQNSSTGCIVNGNLSIINAQFNAYRAQYTYSNCQGQNAVLNGTTFRGIATLDNTSVPEALVVGAQALIGSTGISAIDILERT